MEIKQYIDDLFRYLATYETSYTSFQTEAFLQTYNGIRAVFTALRQQRNQAVETDYTFLDFIQSSPPAGSDLRTVTVQLLITFFESEADVDGRSNQAYTYVRGLRAIKQDAPYLEDHLLPILFRPTALRTNFALNRFLLEEMARFLNSYGPPLDIGESFSALRDDRKILELCRRRLRLGANLVEDRASLEFSLRNAGAFDQLKKQGPLYEQYLKEWGLLRERERFWSRVGRSLAATGRKAKGLFQSSRYSSLMFTQRRPAVALQIGLVLVWIACAILAPVLWGKYSDSRYRDLDRRVNELRQQVTP